MQSDDVGIAEELFEWNVFHFGVLLDFLVRVFVVRQNLTAEPDQNVDHTSPNLSRPNHARRLSEHVEAGEAIENKGTGSIP